MPFGLQHAPAVFQRMMNTIFHDILDVYVVVYLDDIVVFSKDRVSHIAHTKEVLSRLRKYRLFCKWSKCIFFAKSIPFVGFNVSNQGLTLDKGKIDSITEWPSPTTKLELQRFLGLANFYRNFIPRYSAIVCPLTDLTRDVPFVWTLDCSTAFDTIKSLLVSDPILKFPNQKIPFTLETDASDFAIWATLSQPASTESTCIQPFGFYSRKLSSSELNYDVHDKELLAIIDALAHWRHLLSGTSSPFTIISDHNNLLYFRSRNVLTPRHARWALALVEYNFLLSYRSGALNIVADALSRRPDYAPTGPRDSLPRPLLPDSCWLTVLQQENPKPTRVLSESERLIILSIS